MTVRALVALGFLSLFCASCDDGYGSNDAASPSPTAPTTSAPNVVLRGTLFEAAPTEHVPLGGVIVRFMDGANAGRQVGTTGSGMFEITNLRRGGFTIRATKSGYQSVDAGVTLTGDTSVELFLKPRRQIVSQTVTGNVSSTTPTCSRGGFRQPRPCQAFPLEIHNGGRVEATLTWPRAQNDLSLYLVRRQDDRVMAAINTDDQPERVSVDVAGGFLYEMRVFYVGGTSAAGFSLTVSHPN